MPYARFRPALANRVSVEEHVTKTTEVKRLLVNVHLAMGGKENCAKEVGWKRRIL